MLDDAGGVVDGAQTLACVRCGRALKDATSVAAGMGPVCRGKAATSDSGRLLGDTPVLVGVPPIGEAGLVCRRLEDGRAAANVPHIWKMHSGHFDWGSRVGSVVDLDVAVGAQEGESLGVSGDLPNGRATLSLDVPGFLLDPAVYMVEVQGGIAPIVAAHRALPAELGAQLRAPLSFAITESLLRTPGAPCGVSLPAVAPQERAADSAWARPLRVDRGALVLGDSENLTAVAALARGAARSAVARTLIRPVGNGRLASEALLARVIGHRTYMEAAGGAASADLALNALLALGLTRGTADRLHQDFKWAFIASMPRAGGIVRLENINEWIARKLAHIT